jgi:hypothetical protein
MTKAEFCPRMLRGRSSIAFHIIQKFLLSRNRKQFEPEGDTYRAESPGGLKKKLYFATNVVNARDALIGASRSNKMPCLQSLQNMLTHKANEALFIVAIKAPFDCLHSWRYAKEPHLDWRHKDARNCSSMSKPALQHSSSCLDKLVGLIEFTAVYSRIHYRFHKNVLAPCKMLRDCLLREQSYRFTRRHWEWLKC